MDEKSHSGGEDSRQPNNPANNLADNGKRYAKWENQKAAAEQVAKIYAEHGESKRADAINACADWLEWWRGDDNKLRLHATNLCRQRHCPICSWRKSMKWQARFNGALELIKKDLPKEKWLFLTLTIKNCDVDNVRETIKKLNLAFRKMTLSKDWWPATGFIKSVEVTKSEDGKAHPHLHVLLTVPNSYYCGQNYIKQSQWREHWKNALNVDYLPQVNIKAVKTFEGKAMGEVVKSFAYSIKPEKLCLDGEWFMKLHNQLKNMRDVSTGGIIKRYISDADADYEAKAEDETTESEDATIEKMEESTGDYESTNHTTEENLKPKNRRFKYDWNTSTKKYELLKGDKTRASVCPDCWDDFPNTWPDEFRNDNDMTEKIRQKWRQANMIKKLEEKVGSLENGQQYIKGGVETLLQGVADWLGGFIPDKKD